MSKENKNTLLISKLDSDTKQLRPFMEQQGFSIIQTENIQTTDLVTLKKYLPGNCRLS